MIEIRQICPQDRAAWAPLWRDYLAFYDTELDTAIYDSSFARLVDPAVTDYHGFLAWNGDQPVGLVHYLYHRHGWKIEPVCYLQDLFATPAARGLGVGRALIEAVYGAADAAGAGSVYWLTQDFNAEARRLYDRIGVQTPFVKYARS